MKLRTKFILAFLLTTVFLLITVLFGMYVIQKLSRSSEYITEEVGPSLLHLGKIRSSAVLLKESALDPSLRARAAERSSAERPPESELQQFDEQQLAADLKDSVGAYSALASRSPSAHPSAGELARLVDQLLFFAEMFQSARAAGDEAGTAKARRGVTAAFSRLSRVIDLSVEAQVHEAVQRSDLKETFTRHLVRLNYVVILLSVCIAAASALMLASQLARPIVTMRDVANEIGRGNLSARSAHSSSDEIGELSAALNAMAGSLQKTTVSKAYLDKVIQSLPDALFVLDAAGAITTVNAQAAALLDIGEKELGGRRFSELLGGGEAWSELCASAGEAPGEPSKLLETVLRSGRGALIPVHLSAAQLVNLNGELEGHVCAAKDIRYRRRLEIERDKYKSDLQRSEQLASLGTISAIIAHKLNQPLTAVKLFVQQCLRENDEHFGSDLLEDNLHECLSELERAGEIVKDVLYVARPTDESPELDVSIDTVANKVVLALSDQIKSANIEVKTEHLAGLPQVSARPGELDTVFFFLVQNAVHAAEDQGMRDAELLIAGSSSAGVVEIRFQDTCGGIPETDIDRIFELFFSTKPQGKGTGLGLPIVRQIVTRIGGEVSVETTQGAGTCFYVRIPSKA